VIVLPWLVAIELATRGGFLAEAVGHDMLGKVAAAQESHGAPPGYYLALAAVTFWPGSLFLGATALAGWRRRHETAVRFLLAWALPTWLLFELLPTKLPHYVLPVYPALALLAGMALIGPSAPRRHVLETVIAVLWALVSLALAAGLVAAPILFGDGFAWASLIPAAAILVLGLRLLRREPPTVATTALLAALVFAPSFQLLLPGLDRLWLSRGAATLIAREIPGRKLPVDAVGYSEPSLVFLLGTDTRLVPPETAARDPAEKRSAAALVSDRDGAAFQAALAAHGAAATVIGHVGGLDYSNGRRLTLRLYMPTKD
jgi:4-amino-4-deoxy-L-arabinose transferase-like glycosyltransferase